MSLRNWMYLFWTTLLVGGIASLLVGTIYQIIDPEMSVLDFPLYIINFGAGLMFSILSQMGFFAYLTLNYFAQGSFRNRLVMWSAIQWLIILIVFVDLIVLRTIFIDSNKAWWMYTLLPTVMLLTSFGVSYWKSSLTNMKAFTPTFFFIYVATILEAIPALREDNVDTLLYMIIPLFFCNAWQVLVLHKLVNPRKPAQSSS